MQNTWLVLLPAVITVCVAVVSRRPIESLLAGILVGLLMLGPTTALDQFSNMLLEVMMSETIAWVIIVCGLMGSLIMLLLRVGSVDAFSEALAAKAKSSKSALMYTWLLGIIVFIDDYLNALAVGAAMRKVTDQFGVSREKLAYVVDSTAAPICVLVPISTWAVFYASLFQESGFAEPGQGMDLYISAIPYMIYPIVAVLLVPLVALEVIPAFGPMKAAELRSAQSPLRQPATLTDEDNTQEPDREVRLYHFLLPLATLIGFTLWYELDVQIGVIASVTLTILLFGAQRLLAWTEMFDAVLDGIKMMLPALTIVVIAFVFKEVNDQLGLPNFVIANIAPLMTPLLFPVVTFLTMALISFATGSSWGVFAIAIPIILPLATSVGVSIPLAIGALLSASAFGSHACFYSDATVLAAQGSGCDVIDHALTQIPYALIAAAMSCIGLTLIAAF
ncbi:MAG: sodium:proton antiporter [Gammaproteobacteria bacterium]|nr:sodium:proton antiporter [Gammaproteobacteria bacterium]MCH9821670.1 sodium:proton antiporter [Gammaproteobacteria bacterium]HAF37443.1 sodium:proton antiporter [Gammaproteobacteria bacterium]